MNVSEIYHFYFQFLSNFILSGVTENPSFHHGTFWKKKYARCCEGKSSKNWSGEFQNVTERLFCKTLKRWKVSFWPVKHLFLFHQSIDLFKLIDFLHCKITFRLFAEILCLSNYLHWGVRPISRGFPNGDDKNNRVIFHRCKFFCQKYSVHFTDNGIFYKSNSRGI